jgi:hypothetical protein
MEGCGGVGDPHCADGAGGTLEGVSQRLDGVQIIRRQRRGELRGICGMTVDEQGQHAKVFGAVAAHCLQAAFDVEPRDCPQPSQWIRRVRHGR